MALVVMGDWWCRGGHVVTEGEVSVEQFADSVCLGFG